MTGHYHADIVDPSQGLIVAYLNEPDLPAFCQQVADAVAAGTEPRCLSFVCTYGCGNLHGLPVDAKKALAVVLPGRWTEAEINESPYR